MGQMLGEIRVGDFVTVHDHNGSLLGIAKCVKAFATKIRCRTERGSASGDFSIKTGKQIDRDRIARPADAESVQQANEQMDRENDELERAQTAKAQAECDALPEAVKLARALVWFCSCESESTVAKAPIEHLRGIVGWAKANGKETE